MTTATISPWPLVRKGDQQHPVQTLQYLLRARGRNLTVDGVFGPGTDAAVRGFQQQQGLAVNGIVGPGTWSALHVRLAGIARFCSDLVTSRSAKSPKSPSYSPARIGCHVDAQDDGGTYRGHPGAGHRPGPGGGPVLHPDSVRSVRAPSSRPRRRTAAQTGPWNPRWSYPATSRRDRPSRARSVTPGRDVAWSCRDGLAEIPPAFTAAYPGELPSAE